MKTLVFFTLVTAFCTLGDELKNPIVKASRQYWASGSCCASGVIYSLSLSFPNGTKLKSLKVDSIHIDRMCFKDKMLVLNKSDNTAKLNFGVSKSGYDDDLFVPPIQRSYAISKDMVFFRFKHKKFQLAIDTIIEIAPEPYP